MRNAISGAYHISVFGARNVSAQLRVTLSTECVGDAVSLIELQPGSQSSGNMAVLSLDFYRYTAPLPQHIVMAVTPMIGEVDVFVDLLDAIDLDADLGFGDGFGAVERLDA